MKKYYGISILFIYLTYTGCSQSDTIAKANSFAMFKKITTEVENYKLDTSSPPNDKLTRKIIELRKLRGPFNINEVLKYKLEEDKQKKEIFKEESDKFSNFLNSGNGKKWLDNSVIWIYRQQFTYKEVKHLVKFYKTSTGQKMATDFPVIMVESLRASEMIKDIMYSKIKSNPRY